MSDASAAMPGFLRLSAELTGFSEFRLTGTGMAPDYLDTVTRVVGVDLVRNLLDAYSEVPDSADEQARQAELRRRVLADERLGPVARNIIKLWYVGTWYQLPGSWREGHEVSDLETTFVVSPVAYTEGLLWPAAGANPPGAKGPGYGTWAEPSRLSVEDD